MAKNTKQLGSTLDSTRQYNGQYTAVHSIVQDSKTVHWTVQGSTLDNTMQYTGQCKAVQGSTPPEHCRLTLLSVAASIGEVERPTEAPSASHTARITRSTLCMLAALRMTTTSPPSPASAQGVMGTP